MITAESTTADDPRRLEESTSVASTTEASSTETSSTEASSTEVSSNEVSSTEASSTEASSAEASSTAAPSLEAWLEGDVTCEMFIQAEDDGAVKVGHGLVFVALLAFLVQC